MNASVSLLSSTTTTFRSGLPEGWSPPERVEDTIVADGLVVHRAGVSATGPDGEEITGSAASIAQRPTTLLTPASRAWYELLERASVVESMRSRSDRIPLCTRDGIGVGMTSTAALFPESDAPSSWRHARSNGVALHHDWASACDRALWELAERDRVLASWYGHVSPERIELEIPLERVTSLYEWSAWSFAEERPGSFSSGIDVVGVIGFPTTSDAPLALGFGARPSRSAALAEATREAVQVLAFLWGEPIATPPERLEPTAMGHLDSYQARERHAVLREWLAGAHTRYASLSDDRPFGTDSVAFADLTPRWLDGSHRVVRAVCTSARPLVFGDGRWSAHLPTDRRAHPIS